MDPIGRHVFFVGPRKTGTTAFYEIIKDLGLPISKKVKETFFFEKEVPYLPDYEPQFGIDPSHPFLEVSPSYFSNSVACSNLQKFFPEARIVVTLRHPVDRALSALTHIDRIGIMDAREFCETLSANKHIRNIIRNSSYEPCISMWSKHFGAKVIQIKQMSDGKYSETAIKQLGEFVDINFDAQSIRDRRLNVARVARSATFASCVQRGKTVVRSLGLHGLVPKFKWIEPLIYRSSTAAYDYPEVRQFFLERMFESVDYYESAPDAVVLGS